MNEIFLKSTFRVSSTSYRAFLVAQMVKNPPAMQETQVQSLGWEDSLEKGKVIHSSTLAWRIPRTEEPGRLWSMVFQRVGHDWVTKCARARMHTHAHARAHTHTHTQTLREKKHNFASSVLANWKIQRCLKVPQISLFTLPAPTNWKENWGKYHTQKHVYPQWHARGGVTCFLRNRLCFQDSSFSNSQT